MTSRIAVSWPDARLFDARDGRPYRILAVADEPDPSLDSPATRQRVGPIDLIIGCGDLPVDYLQFVTDAFNAPLAYVRGNHDVGGDWATGEATRLHLPEPLVDGRTYRNGGLTVLGFNGIPFHGGGGYQVGDFTTWRAALAAWRRLRWRPRRAPVLCVSHVAPRGINDGPDRMHRGSVPLRWLAGRLRPPLWLHGHTTLVTRRLEDRAVRRDGTVFYNAAGAVVVELRAPGDALSRALEMLDETLEDEPFDEGEPMAGMTDDEAVA
jgi:uncharacterized protein